jgi:hypothetical protein
MVSKNQNTVYNVKILKENLTCITAKLSFNNLKDYI